MPKRPHLFPARPPSGRAPTRPAPPPPSSFCLLPSSFCLHSPKRPAFTLVELLVVIGIIVLLISILVPTLSRARRAARNSTCCSNLRQMAVAFVHYAIDNHNHLPSPVQGVTSWEDLLHKYAPPLELYHCPADDDLFASFNSSYDWRDTGDPDTTLAGRALSDVRRPGVVLAYEALPGWHYKRKINVVRVDGSVATCADEECFTDLATPVRPDIPSDHPPATTGAPVP